MIKAVVTDLDNTLYSWVDYIVPSLEAMVSSLCQSTGLPRITVIQSLKKVYERYRSNEYPFVIQEAECFRTFAVDFGSFHQLVLEPASTAFKIARSRYLRLYPGVAETLGRLQAMRSPWWGSPTRPETLPSSASSCSGSIRVCSSASTPCRGSPCQRRCTTGSWRASARGATARPSSCASCPRRWRSPTRAVWRASWKELGVEPSEVLYVGDSRKKDIAVAQRVGCLDALAEYGTYRSAEYAERLEVISAPSATKRLWPTTAIIGTSRPIGSPRSIRSRTSWPPPAREPPPAGAEWSRVVCMPSARTTVGVSRFRCIGTDCEFTCCSGWHVPVDEAHYNDLREKLGAAEFEAVVERVPDKDPRGFAAMKLKVNGDCVCLGPDRLCTLQTRLGEPAIPNTCAQYPRALGTVHEQREIWGHLSCPEMARQCLLAADGMDLAEGPVFDRPIAGRTLPAEKLPYEEHLDDIRATALALLSLKKYPIAVRFFFLAYLGKRTEAFFHKGVPTVNVQSLATEIVRLQTPALLDALATGFNQLQTSSRLNAVVVNGILQARADNNLMPLVAKVLRTYVAEGAVKEEAGGQLVADPDRLWASYLQRRARWEATSRTELDLYLENHAKAFWLREWYVKSPNLLSHVQRHLCQVAVIRFLMFGHPDLQGIAEGDAIARHKALDGVVVEVISRVSRAIEHDARFLGDLQGALAKNGMQDFAHTTILAAA